MACWLHFFLTHLLYLYYINLDSGDVMGKILLKQEMRETIGTEGKVGGNSSLLVHSGPQLSCGERENKGANKTSKRKS